MTKTNRKLLAFTSIMAIPILAHPAYAEPLKSIELLGKNVFFDTNLSKPESSQACASCHDPSKGWILPNSKINDTIVVAPGAKRKRLGSIKTPQNAYATFSPPFALTPTSPFTPARGGVFWDGRAEGCGVTGFDCPIGKGNVSETIEPADLPLFMREEYVHYLTPTADQALNPFPNDVEQNIREKKVCKTVEIATYSYLYALAYGEQINCKNKPIVPTGDPAYRTSFKRIAVALAAWQASDEVNSFSSKRDRALRDDPDHSFPLKGLTPQENRGHDLFYGTNESGLNPPRPFTNPPGTRVPTGNCRLCHNGTPTDEADPSGTNPRQLYTDFAYHNIGVPFNREITTVAKGEKTGLSAHVPGDAFAGLFKTPSMRNVTKGASRSFVKAYTHNGYFKTLNSLVHFYNTRDALPKCEEPPFNIVDATAKEALAKGCWPKSEFVNPAAFIIGNNGLTGDEEDAIAAYIATLDDTYTPVRP